MTVGESLKKSRKQKGLTQTELAALIGVHTAQLSWWETGRVYPSIMNCISLADVLDITLDELVGRRM